MRLRALAQQLRTPALMRCRACQLKWYPRPPLPPTEKCPSCSSSNVERQRELSDLGLPLVGIGLLLLGLQAGNWLSARGARRAPPAMSAAAPPPAPVAPPPTTPRAAATTPPAVAPRIAAAAPLPKSAAAPSAKPPVRPSTARSE